MGTRRFLEIPSLDGLRAVSIAIVFAAHVGLENRIPGGFGVTIFFVLSGFLITTLLRLENSRTGAVSFRGFYIRRAFRIWPLFYAVLGLAVVASWLGLGTGEVSGTAVTAQAGHITNYWGIFRSGVEYVQGTGLYWSLAVEEHFYLLFPLVFLLLNRAGVSYRTQAIGFVAAWRAVLLWRCFLVYGADVGDGTDVLRDGHTDRCAAVWVRRGAVRQPSGRRAEAVETSARAVCRRSGRRSSWPRSSSATTASARRCATRCSPSPSWRSSAMSWRFRSGCPAGSSTPG